MSGMGSKEIKSALKMKVSEEDTADFLTGKGEKFEAVTKKLFGDQDISKKILEASKWGEASKEDMQKQYMDKFLEALPDKLKTGAADLTAIMKSLTDNGLKVTVQMEPDGKPAITMLKPSNPYGDTGVMPGSGG